jgi:hypothetical protein
MMVDWKGDVTIFNERFNVVQEFIGEYVWLIIDTKEQSLIIGYNDREMIVSTIKKCDYVTDEPVIDLDMDIFSKNELEGVPMC